MCRYRVTRLSAKSPTPEVVGGYRCNPSFKNATFSFEIIFNLSIHFEILSWVTLNQEYLKLILGH